MLNLNNAEKLKKNFMYQNLQKSKCFKSNFTGSNFDFVSFRGAHMKSCLFDHCSFKGAEFIGANLKGSSFKNAYFEDVVFEAARLEDVSFDGATFKNVKFILTEIGLEGEGISKFDQMPTLALSDALLHAVETLMKHPHVKTSRVLDTQSGAMNTIAVMRLLERFTESELIQHLPLIEAAIDRPFYTLSYLIKHLEKQVSA